METVKKSVLLVDDDQKFINACRLFLGQRYVVQIAHSGMEALELLDSNPFPVVVTDMHMPMMNGIEFIKLARQKNPDSIYMLLTASREREMAIEAYNQANVYCVISKPCSLKDLSEFVEAAHSEFAKRTKPI